MRQTEPSSFAAVVLAAGFSSRMGALKALLPFGETSVIARVLACYAAAGLRQIVVVTGHEAAAVAAAARRGQPDVRLAHNADFAAGGMFSSVLTGLRALDLSGLAGFFLTPVDYPLVRPQTLGALLAAWRPGETLLHPTYRGERGHPPLIGAACLPAILAHDGAGGLKAALAPFDTQARELAVDDPGILLDIDTRAEYERALAFLTR